MVEVSKLVDTKSTYDFQAFLKSYSQTMAKKLEDFRKFRDLSDSLGKEILKLKDPYDFGIAYFLYLSSVNILYNVIEEDSLKGTNFLQLINVVKEKLIQIHDLKIKGKKTDAFIPIVDIINEFWKIITQDNFIDQKEVEFKYKGEHIPLRMSIRGDKYCVATHFFPFFFNLDELLLTPKRVKVIGPAFLKEVKEAMESEHVNKLCFIEKLYGPVGAVSLLPYLVEKTGLPSIIYRPAHWNPKSKITGKVTKADRICVVYDLAVTGGALLDCMYFLERSYPKVEVVSAVVLYDYNVGAKEKLLKQDVKLRSIIPLTHKEIIKIFLKRYEEEWNKLNNRILKQEITYDEFLKEGKKLYHKFATYELFARKR